MTDYRIHGFDHNDGWIRAWVKVGKREKLEQVEVPRAEAWRLLRNLASALEATE